MAAEEQHPPTEHSPARAYVNFAHSGGGPYEFTLTMGYREGEAQPVIVQPVAMSWEFVPILIRLLQEQLDKYQEAVGPVRNLMAEPVEDQR